MSPERRKQLTLVACILGSATALLDGTVVNVALPAIEKDLGGGLSAQQWVVNGYALALGSLILIGGSLADVYGERRIFALGVAGFGLTSLLCAVAPSPAFLIGARILQGCTSALLTPSALAVIISTFAPDERGKAIGSWTAWGGIAALIGPVLGGQLVQSASWRWVFLINVPLVLINLWLILRVMPPGAEGRRERHVDIRGAALVALGLAGPVFALIAQPDHGWGSVEVLLPLVAGLILLGVFFSHERRTRDPMLPLGLFSRPNFGAGNIETFAMYAGLSILFFLLVIFLQEVAGWSPVKAGTATIPVTVVMFLFSRRAGALADRHGPRLFMTVGPIISAVGLLLLLRVDDTPSYFGDVLPAILVFAIGLTTTVSPLTAAVLAGVQEREAGIGSAVNNAVARVAGLIGVAVIGTLIGGALTTTTFHRCLILGAALLVAGGLVGLFGIHNPERIVRAETCPGGALIGAPEDAADCPGARQEPEAVPAAA